MVPLSSMAATGTRRVAFPMNPETQDRVIFFVLVDTV